MDRRHRGMPVVADTGVALPFLPESAVLWWTGMPELLRQVGPVTILRQTSSSGWQRLVASAVGGDARQLSSVLRQS